MGKITTTRLGGGVRAMVVAVLALVAAAATLLAVAAPAAAVADTGVGGSNCTRWCGNVSIPYPFGIEDGCYHATTAAGGFNLTCNADDHSSDSRHKLFLGDGTVEVLEISIPNATVRINSTRVDFTGDGQQQQPQQLVANKTWGAGLPIPGPYFLSEQYDHRNMLRVEGCNVQVNLLGLVGGTRQEGNDSRLVASCTAICPTIGPQDEAGMLVGDGSCAGIRCCQASIDIGYVFYAIQIHMLNDGGLFPDYGSASSVYIADQDFNFSTSEGDPAGAGLGTEPLGGAPATLSWVIASNLTCPPAANMSAPECRSTHSSCLDKSTFMSTGTGYTCQCSAGYQGNPYIDDGCKDIDECESPESYSCYGNCTNTPGNFTCLCPTGYRGNASVVNGCKDINECENPEAYSCYGICQNFPGTFQCQCPKETYGSPFTKDGCVMTKRKNSYTGLSIGLGLGGGTSLLLVICAPLISRKIKLQKDKRLREKFFNQNHGLLLQQLVSHNGDIGERMIVTLRDLEKATNNFDKARVIGGGGHGVVFKGIIDLKVVAIKKSRIIVEREINEFINEVAILSQVNHRNVVKLLGCCLESEVPLLVYEFISNGTLYQHLHVEGPMSLPWVDRIRIALEVSRALSYLHSAASMPIFHRDIKSSNVLLDDSLTAKVSDFGTSRYILIDQTGVTTEVQGTKGYLDPMYYYTGRLTDKSDVFSFGVLLIELLTRKQPFVYRSRHGDNLVSHFRKLLAIGNLVGIIDPQVMEEEDGEVQELATLAVMCTKLKGEDRPTMREVEIILESILIKKKQVPYITTRRHDENDETPIHENDETPIQCMSIEMATNKTDRRHAMNDMNSSEISRQYTMEQEILLSGRYPR